MDRHDPARHNPTGQYANYFQAGYNEAEFVIDCGQLFEGDSGILMHTRLVIGPLYAKAFAEILLKSIAGYEQRYGRINTSDE
jgi:hypothetical protein